MIKRRPIKNRTRTSALHRLWLVAALVVGVLVYPSINAHAATLTNSSVAISDPRPSTASVSYNFTGSSVTNASIKCVKVVFATTATGSTKPSGMVTASGITINASSTLLTAAGWSRGGADPDGTVTFTNASGNTPAAGTKTFNLDGFTNSSSFDTALWMRLNTYDNVDCSTTPRDNTTVQFILTNGSTLTLTVDNTLTFTVNAVLGSQSCDGTTTTTASTATTIPFGTVTAGANAIVCQDLQAATNGTGGYTIYARYTAAPTNALSQTIANHSGTNAAPTAFSAAGTEAYGYSTNDSTLAGTNPTANRFTSPSQGWAAMTTTNAELGYEVGPVVTTTYRVGHQVGVSLTTKPGTYATTVIYTCTPIY